MRYKDLDGEFLKEIKTVLKQNKFMRFDIFIISKVLKKDYMTKKISGETRAEAYHLFCKITGDRRFAAVPTVKRWFGINGYTLPRRENIFEIAYVLKMSENGLREWLMEGLGEPDVQFNDYHEVIWLYGLVNGMTWEDAEKNIETYEKRLKFEIKLEKTHSTNYLMEQFDARKRSDEKEFMEWMYMNTSSFKGYSLTTLEYVNIYKDIITEYVCNESMVSLKKFLAETDFYSWTKKKNADENERIVQKYLYYIKRKRDKNVSEGMMENIMEANRIAHMSPDSRQKMLADIFSTSKSNNEFGNLTRKRLSDILNLPIQLEKNLRAGIALNELKYKDDTDICPEWVAEFIESCAKKTAVPENVKEAKDWLKSFKVENHRRCRLVQRKDLLPMILYVAQRRYTEENSRQNKEYEQNSAKEYFVNMANATLSSCGMTSINEKYKLDMVLLSTYQKDDMYSYSEVVEITSEI